MKKTLIAIAFAASFNVYAESWEACSEKFEARLSAAGKCGSSGCADDDWKTVFDVCGAPPKATGAEKKRSLSAITEECGNDGNFDRQVKNFEFSNATRKGLWWVSAEDARKACAAGPAQEKMLVAKAKAKEKAEKSARDAITVKIGSPEKNIVAKFGKPEVINKTVTALGIHKQYVYSNGYVYTQDGIVIAWQKSE